MAGEETIEKLECDHSCFVYCCHWLGRTRKNLEFAGGPVKSNFLSLFSEGQEPTSVLQREKKHSTL